MLEKNNKTRKTPGFLVRLRSCSSGTESAPGRARELDKVLSLLNVLSPPAVPWERWVVLSAGAAGAGDGAGLADKGCAVSAEHTAEPAASGAGMENVPRSQRRQSPASGEGRLARGLRARVGFCVIHKF